MSADPTRSGPVTMAAVARLAGVSQVSVSRALNHPDKVSPDTLARIREAIRVTGFVPNAVAGALASRRSRMIAALVPSITNIVYSGLLRDFIEAMRLAGYQVILAETGFSQAEEQALVQSLLGRRPDGILLTGIHHSPDTRRILLGAAIPVVEVWDVTDTPVDICVGFSHQDAGRAVAAYVHRKGYPRAAAISAGDERALRRKDAFATGLTDLGYAAPAVVAYDAPASIANGREGLARLLDDGFRDGPVFCSSDLLAHGVLIEAQSRGLSVPGDVAAIGFGDQDFAAHTLPPLTTVHVDRALLGRRAADALLARISGEALASRRIDIRFQIVERDSA